MAIGDSGVWDIVGTAGLNEATQQEIYTGAGSRGYHAQ